MLNVAFSNAICEHLSGLKSKQSALRQTRKQRGNPSTFQCRSQDDLLLLVDGLLARYALYFSQDPVWKRLGADHLGVYLAGNKDKLTISVQWEDSDKKRSGNLALIWIIRSSKNFVVSIDSASELRFMLDRYSKLLELPSPGIFTLSLVESLGRPIRYADVWEDSDV